MSGLRGHAGLLMQGSGSVVYPSARYWRFYLGMSAADYICCQEAEWRATPGGADLTTPGSGLYAASSDFNGVNGAAAFDDDTTNFSTGAWASASPASNGWVRYDFGSAISIAQLSYMAMNHTLATARSPATIMIETSPDDATWTTLKTYTGLTWIQAEVKLFSTV